MTTPMRGKMHKLTKKLPRNRLVIFVIAGFILIGTLTLLLARAATSTVIVNDNTIGSGLNQWQYSGTNWAYYTDGGNKYNGDDHSSSAAGDYATLRFSGIKVEYYGAKSPQAGIVGISVDGGSETMVDLYSSSRSDNTLLYTSPGLAQGDHTLKIRLTGTKNAAANDDAAAVDRAIVTVETGGSGFFSLEAEQGSLSGSAATVSDSSASGSQAVKFGAVSPTPTPTPSPGGGSGTWWSGQSDTATTQDGSFAAWRGRPIEIGGNWASSQNAADAIESPMWSLAPGTAYANVPRMDYAFGAMIDNSGENWAAAASGAYDSRWAQQFQRLKTAWGSRPAGNLYIRFAHEFNGNWYPWKVDNANVTNFKNAWIRFKNVRDQNFPGAQIVWCPNAGSSYAYDIRTLYPGNAYVDVIAVDKYNNYPWVNDQAGFNSEIVSTSNGGPLGLESYRQFALQQGKPFAVSEWSNDGNPAGEGNQGGGDGANYMQYFNTWLKTNGSQTPAAGKVLYEVLFNVPGYSSSYYSLFPLNLEPGNTNAAAKYQELW